MSRCQITGRGREGERDRRTDRQRGGCNAIAEWSWFMNDVMTLFSMHRCTAPTAVCKGMRDACTQQTYIINTTVTSIRSAHYSAPFRLGLKCTCSETRPLGPFISRMETWISVWWGSPGSPCISRNWDMDFCVMGPGSLSLYQQNWRHGFLCDGAPSPCISRNEDKFLCGGAPSPCISRNGNVDFCVGVPSPCISRNGNVDFCVGAPSPCISRNGNVDFCDGAPSPCISRNGNVDFCNGGSLSLFQQKWKHGFLCDGASCLFCRGLVNRANCSIHWIWPLFSAASDGGGESLSLQMFLVYFICVCVCVTFYINFYFITSVLGMRVKYYSTSSSLYAYAELFWHILYLGRKEGTWLFTTPSQPGRLCQGESVGVL